VIDSPQISDPVAARIVAFLREIGLDVQVREIVEPTFLPGVQIEHGGLVVDPARLTDAGDLLHEAGHLAVVAPTERAAMHIDAGDSPANEMMAIGWSYAALLHLELSPSVVFHERGYKGGAQSLIDNFAGGRYLGVPMLQWVGLTLDDTRAREAGESPYPHMLRWLRAE
jgi:hypothetical protein